MKMKTHRTSNLTCNTENMYIPGTCMVQEYCNVYELTWNDLQKIKDITRQSVKFSLDHDNNLYSKGVCCLVP